MMRPRVTSVPRTLSTYSWDSMPSSSWMRTGGITMPELAGDLAADQADAAQQRAAAAAPSTSGTRPKPIAELERVDRESLDGLLARSAGSAGLCAAGSAAAAAAASSSSGMPLRTPQPIAPKIAAINRNGSFGRPGTSANRPITAAGDHRRLALAQDLVGDVATEVLVGGRARDDDAGRHRDQQRRDLRGEAVADGQQRVVVGGFGERPGGAGACRR